MDYPRVKRLEISDKSFFDSYAAFHPEHIGIDIDFRSVFEWGVYDQVLLIDAGDYISTYRMYGDEHVFFPPFTKRGVDFSWACKDLLTRSGFENACIHLVPPCCLNRLNREDFVIEDERADYDYIYLASDLIDLTGKKFHSKRNHINKFESTYDFVFRRYRKEDYKDVSKLYSEWQSIQPSFVDMRFERSAFFTALDNIFVLGYKCGVIEVEGAVRAVSIVSVNETNNLGQVHFEKGDRAFDGIYAAINNYCAQEFFSGCTYVNRQDDLGIEGLRKAKLSYNPVMLLEKSIVRLNPAKGKDK